MNNIYLVNQIGLPNWKTKNLNGKVEGMQVLISHSLLFQRYKGLFNVILCPLFFWIPSIFPDLQKAKKG